MRYLIWSFRNRQWYGPNECGYTSNPEQAGRYSSLEAGVIVVNVGLPGGLIAVDEQLATGPLNGPAELVEDKLEQWRKI